MDISNIGLKRIYEPKGKAREYAALALNVYTGCDHQCKYCYNRNKQGYDIKDIFGKDFEEGDTVEAVGSKILFETIHDAKILSDLFKTENGNDCPEILLSFTGDVYQSIENQIGLTREIIKILIKFDLPFTILTKGGMFATADFDLLSTYKKFRFGTTLIFWKNNDIGEWEPGASTFTSRVSAIQVANNLGMNTWVSMEPVIDPQQALDLVDMLSPIVNSWKVGKINYNDELEKSVDWIKFRDDIRNKFKEYDIVNYYLKDSLTKLK